MSDRMNRPPTVWLAQALLIIFALIIFSAFLLNLIILLKNSGRSYSPVRAVIGYSVMLGLVLLLLSSFWGMAKRKMYGRWLGLLSLVFLWGLMLLIHFYRPSGPNRYYEYENSAELVGAVVFQIFLNGLFLLLILRLAFAKKVRAFFGGGVESA